MADGLSGTPDRRTTPRSRLDHGCWQSAGRLRPAQDVRVLDLSAGGARLESAGQMSPGARAELQLFGEVRWQLRGRVQRCAVSRLTPLCYEGAIQFDEPCWDLG